MKINYKNFPMIGERRSIEDKQNKQLGNFLQLERRIRGIWMLLGVGDEIV